MTDKINTHALTLIQLGGSDVCIQYLTRLAPRRIAALRAGSTPDGDHSQQKLDDFFKIYGSWTCCDIDVDRFVSAVSASGICPDDALRALRLAQFERLAG